MHTHNILMVHYSTQLWSYCTYLCAWVQPRQLYVCVCVCVLHGVIYRTLLIVSVYEIMNICVMCWCFEWMYFILLFSVCVCVCVCVLFCLYILHSSFSFSTYNSWSELLYILLVYFLVDMARDLVVVCSRPNWPRIMAWPVWIRIVACVLVTLCMKLPLMSMDPRTHDGIRFSAGEWVGMVISASYFRLFDPIFPWLLCTLH